MAELRGCEGSQRAELGFGPPVASLGNNVATLWERTSTLPASSICSIST